MDGGDHQNTQIRPAYLTYSNHSTLSAVYRGTADQGTAVGADEVHYQTLNIHFLQERSKTCCKTGKF